MVVFTCNNCGDSLQKPKVAKHYQFHCRNAVFLTCVDCHKDFRGDEYVAHTKCITEDERYGGKNYTAKQSANKGERKQQAWINVVQNVLTNSKNLTVPERNLLNSIARHENIPRKKAKFLNFIRNISNNKANMANVDSVWEKMESAFKEATADNNNDDAQENKKQNVSVEENQNNSNMHKESSNAEETNAVNEVKDTENTKKKKKSKKRQLEADENDNSEPVNKRKNETEATDTIEEENNHENGISKFSLKNAILEIITAKGEISLKKLRKKVIAQYLSNFPDSTSEKANSKFEKKLGKISNVLITEDKVKLTSS